VTPRYGTDPVSTTLVNNLLRTLTQRGTEASTPCSSVGESARGFLATFGVAAAPLGPEDRGAIFVGSEALDETQTRDLRRAAEEGATVVLLPKAASGPAFGLRLREERLFIGRLVPSPLLSGLSDGDVYLKQWVTLPVAQDGEGWQSLVQPGLLATKTVGAGRLLACQLDPESLGQSRARVKVLRFWNLLLANLGIDRSTELFPGAAAPRVYEANEWEEIPPYMDW